MNLTDPIWRACKAWPERMAVRIGGQTLRYGALAQVCTRVAARLVAAGVRQEDVVTLSLGHPLAELIAILGAVRIGATVTLQKSNWAPALKTELLDRHGARWLVGDDRKADPVAISMGVRCLAGPDLWLSAGKEGESAGSPAVARGLDSSPWRLWLSSGTTGTPKTIPQSHALGALGLSLATAMAGDSNQRLMIFADLAISVAAVEALAQLAQGGELVLTHPIVLPEVLATIRACQPARLVTTTGNAAYLVEHAQKVCPQGRGGGDSLRTVLIAGSAVAPALRNSVARHLCERIDVAYGSTEAGRMALSSVATHAQRPDTAGRLLPWVEARAFDEGGLPLPAGRSGLLGFRSPTVFAGYLKDPKTTAGALRRGWFFPGDRGSVDEGGFLTLHGRDDDVLNIGGRKLEPTQIERLLNSHPGVRESAVLALNAPNGRPVLVGMLVVDGPFDAHALRDLCRARLGPSMTPRHFSAIAALPRNDAGKVNRRALASRLSIGPATVQDAVPTKE